MDSLQCLMSDARHQPPLLTSSRSQNPFVQAKLCSVVGRKGRHLRISFCLTGDTMDVIKQCLVYFKASAVSFQVFHSSLTLLTSAFFCRSYRVRDALVLRNE